LRVCVSLRRCRTCARLTTFKDNKGNRQTHLFQNNFRCSYVKVHFGMISRRVLKGFCFELEFIGNWVLYGVCRNNRHFAGIPLHKSDLNNGGTERCFIVHSRGHAGVGDDLSIQITLKYFG
jgi:hypothetical protein